MISIKTRGNAKYMYPSNEKGYHLKISERNLFWKWDEKFEICYLNGYSNHLTVFTYLLVTIITFENSRTPASWDILTRASLETYGEHDTPCWTIVTFSAILLKKASFYVFELFIRKLGNCPVVRDMRGFHWGKSEGRSRRYQKKLLKVYLPHTYIRMWAF